jgi:transposase
MTEQLSVTTERVDDIPILLAQSDDMGIPELLDEYFKPHGNWEGTSLGWTTAIWVAHMVSEGDHRMNQVQDWVAQRVQTLHRCTGQEVREQSWSDDRLALVLDALAQPEAWQRFERALNQRIIRVYQLQPQRVRLDSTTAKGYWTVSEDGLFQLGYSKDHRPDLPQLKVMLSALDPLGLPLVTQVVAGKAADDPLYIPAINQVSQSLPEHGVLYVGDCKMAALSTRAYVQAQGDYYLCPLANTQLPDAELDRYLQPVWSGECSLLVVHRATAEGEGEEELIAEGFEQTVGLSSEVANQPLSWTERQVIVRSVKLAAAAQAALLARLGKAQAALTHMNAHKQGKKVYRDADALQQAAHAILKEHRVEGLLRLQIEEQVTERAVRAYGSHPASVRVERTFHLHSQVDEAAMSSATRRLGWRVYATNHPNQTLTLEQAVLAYREEYLVERGFGRLKGKPLSLSPMYVQSDQRATGLIHLLSLALRILILLEWRCRQRLADRHESLPGLYAGNPKRSTRRPTAEALLRAFQLIHLSVVTLGQQTHRHLTPLSELQKRILVLLDISPSIYDRLGAESLKPT